ncbi:GRAM domain-containing protein 1C isoform X1 [Hippocampus comes]|uniref:GRAM domain containing 1C n=2 Tax=Hippocampus comes TaxID=109280 RepID=A0A3Q3DL11_HIPCM|nr:PREDICTED: GRAM domain-containing protein 1C isoform X1 [Hippocampus comes]
MGPLRVSAPEQMDQLSNWSGVGDDITDETTSLIEDEVSDEEGEESSDNQTNCIGVPSPPVPTYKQRLDDFRRLFKDVASSDILLLDYPCALQRDILLQGRLYLTHNCLCFYSNVFRGTKISLALKDISHMSREKTARFIPNAIQICTSKEKLFFTSFSAREKSFNGVFRLWQNALLNKSLTNAEVWQMVKQHYGNELGLSHEEMESTQFPADLSMQSRHGGDDGCFAKLEKTPTIRLPAPELPSFENEEVSSAASSQRSPFEEERRISLSPRRSPVPFVDRSEPESVATRLRPSPVEDGVSQESGSESVEEAEERVGLPKEQGRLYLNKVFHMSASRMFDLLFTESAFIRRFMTVRKITNPSFVAWQKDPSGDMKRSLNYTITISNPLIGKFSTATEYQTLYKESLEGQSYLVDSEVYTHDVPYHDYFYTQNRYYIKSHTKRKCRLKVYTDVKYKKQPWGLVKSFITKNSWSGIEDYFRQLEAELLEEEAEINQGAAEVGGLRRRRRTFSRTMPEHMKPKKHFGQPPDEHRDGNMGPAERSSPHRWNITAIVGAMSVILLILTVLNVGLFVKLLAMEDVAHRMYLTTKHRLKERAEASIAPEYPSRQGPPLRSREEAQLLRTVLQDSINLLEQLRRSLMLLQQKFALANQTTVSW